MKKNTLLVIVAIVFAAVGVRAQEGQGPSVTVSTYVANRYLAFGTGSLLSKDPVVQSDLFVSFKNGAYADLWNSRSLKGSWDDGSFGNEVDYGFGWKGALGDGLGLNVGATYFDEPRAFTLGAGDILYAHAFLTKDFKLLTIVAGYEDYIAMPRSGFKGGRLISLGASGGKVFSDGRVSLRASVTGVYDSGTIGTKSGFILRGGAGVDLKATKRMTINLIGASWHIPLTPHDRRKSDTMVTTGLTYNMR